LLDKRKEEMTHSSKKYSIKTLKKKALKLEFDAVGGCMDYDNGSVEMCMCSHR
jgi:hypothetical protein